MQASSLDLEDSGLLSSHDYGYTDDHEVDHEDANDNVHDELLVDGELTLVNAIEPELLQGRPDNRLSSYTGTTHALLKAACITFQHRMFCVNAWPDVEAAVWIKRDWMLRMRNSAERIQLSNGMISFVSLLSLLSHRLTL
jgi:hypothetical protein